MCNLYSITKSAEAIKRLFEAYERSPLNWPSQSAVFPDQTAPVIRTDRDGARELIRMRWGFPPPPKLATQPVTNIRNVASPYWRGWLKPEFRCLVPATSFCEYQDTKPRKTPVWFALADERPIFAFAGLWRPWTGVRGPKRDEPLPEEHLLYSFLTTEANEVVRPIHPKAMPVLLTTPRNGRHGSMLRSRRRWPCNGRSRASPCISSHEAAGRMRTRPHDATGLLVEGASAGRDRLNGDS